MQAAAPATTAVRGDETRHVNMTVTDCSGDNWPCQAAGMPATHQLAAPYSSFHGKILVSAAADLLLAIVASPHETSPTHNLLQLILWCITRKDKSDGLQHAEGNTVS